MEKESLPIQIQWLLSMPVQLFKISFIIGTLLLFLFMGFKEMGIALVGFYYLLLAIAINLLALAVFVVFSFIELKYQKLILLRASIMLINIPIAYLYYYIFSLII